MSAVVETKEEHTCARLRSVPCLIGRLRRAYLPSISFDEDEELATMQFAASLELPAWHLESLEDER